MRKFAYLGFIAVFIFGQWQGLASAQQVEFTPRESIIFLTLNHMQHKEEALQNAMMEAQLKLAEARARQSVSKTPGKSASTARHPSRGGLGIVASLPKMHPYLSLASTYDSNIDRLQFDRKGESSQQTITGVKANIVSPGRTINFDLNMNQAYLDRRTDKNTQTASGGFVSNFNVGRLLMTFSDLYSSNYAATPELGVKTSLINNYWLNTAGFSVARHFNRIGFDLGFDRSDTDYEPAASSNDQYSDTYKFNSYLQLAPKTRASFNYSRGHTKTKKSASITNSDDFKLALTTIFSSKITALISMDYNPVDSKAADDSLNRTFSEQVSYSLSNRTNLSFIHSHNILHSATDSSYSLKDDFSLSGNHRFAFNPKLNLSLSYGASYIDNVKQETYSNLFTWGLGFSYAYTRWLDFSFQWTNSLADYNTSSTSNTYRENVLTLQSQARF